MGNVNQRRRKGQHKKFKTFSTCVTFVHKQHIRNVEGWYEYARSPKKPESVPIRPDLVYKGRGWQGWKHFLGSKMYSYEEAKEVVSKLKLINGAEWRAKAGLFFPRPSRMPLCPDQVYGSEWEGWATFLGQDRRIHVHSVPPTPPTPMPKREGYRPFEEALKLVAKLGLKSNVEYAQWRGKYPHTDLPYRPDEVYDKEWLGWGPFLGTKPLTSMLTDTTVMYVGKRSTDPSNVYIIAKEELGKSEVMHKAEREGFKVLRVWKYDPTLRDEVDRVLDANASAYGPDPDYIVGNIFGLYGDMMNVLMVV